MLAGTFLMGVTMASTSTYLPILITELGGTQAEYGIALFIMAAIEFVAMMFLTKLKKRFGTVTLLIIGFFGFFLKSVAFAMSENIWQIHAFCLLQCLAYALIIPGTVLYLGESVDKKYLATALLINLSVCTTAEMIANPVCGLLAERVGVRVMMIIASLSVFLAGIIFLAFVPKKLQEISTV